MKPLSPRSGAVREAARKLGSLPNVTHVTVGRKERGGITLDALAIKAYVRHKGAVPASHRIPARLKLTGKDGSIHVVPTDVIETGGQPETFGVRAGSLLRAFDDDLGVAGLTFTKGEHSYVLTNAHVAFDIARDGATGPVAWLESVGGAAIPLGSPSAWTPLSEDRVADGDAAAILSADPNIVDVRQIAGSSLKVARMDMLRKDLPEYALAIDGQFLRCVAPEPIASDVPIDVDGVTIVYRRFWQLRSVDDQAKKGLSGAVLLRRNGQDVVACGLVFGGISPTFIFAFSFRPLFEKIYAALP